MSPAKMFQEFVEPERMIVNGPRPSPLSINKSSHVIQKQSSSCLTMISSQVQEAKQRNPNSNSQHRQPVIIYTHSPKIIHTHPRDFMALVQKLTGLSRSEDGISRAESQEKCQVLESWNKDNMKNVALEDNESSSAITDEKCGDGSDDVKGNSFMVSPMQKMPNANFADIPLFTPNSNDLFSSFLESMKMLLEY